MRGREGNSTESGRSEGAWEGDSSRASRPCIAATWASSPLEWRPERGREEDN